MEPTIEDYFRSVPEEVTELPIFEDENGIFYAYGHVEPHEMTLAIHAVDSYIQDEESELKVNPEDMQYYYGKIKSIDEDEDVTFSLCGPTEEGAFPITIWNFK